MLAKEYFILCELYLMALSNGNSETKDSEQDVDTVLNTVATNIFNRAKSKADYTNYKDRLTDKFNYKITELNNSIKTESDDSIKKELRNKLLFLKYGSTKIKTFLELKSHSSIHEEKLKMIKSSYISVIQPYLKPENLSFEDFLIKQEAAAAASDQFISEGSKHYPQFLNTGWLFYFYGDQDEGTSHFPIINRWFLTIDELGVCSLYSKGDAKPSLGHIQNHKNSSSNIFELFFDDGISGGTNLHILISGKKDIKRDNIFPGQFLQADSSQGNIISSTCVIENIAGKKPEELAKAEISFKARSNFSKVKGVVSFKDLKISIVEIELVHYFNWEDFIPKLIARYLAHKRYNYRKIKAFSGTSTKDSLASFFKKQKERTKKETKHDNIIANDIFILCPKHSLDKVRGFSKAQREKMEDEIDKYFFKEPHSIIKSDFIKNREISDGIINRIFTADDEFINGPQTHTIYFQPRIKRILYANPQTSTWAGDVLTNEFEAIKKSRYVVFILPLNYSSSALIKLGWALALQKEVIVFRTNSKVKFPAIIKESSTNIRVIQEAMTIQKIKQELLSYFPRTIK